MSREIVTDLFATEVRDVVRGAIRRSQTRLRSNAPTLAAHARSWQRELTGGAAPEAYFLHPEAFPLVLLPWWLESTIHEPRSAGFQRDVVYSSVSGYYFVRMIDDLMDHDR